jgi:2-amino-4-hydroxy-6-hydroxymethyldihydropteridine diphosphokinase
MQERYFILLGSNIGNREKALSVAAELLTTALGSPDKCSSIYETAAWGKEDQQPFLNQVISGLSELPATELMKISLDIERSMGRIRTEKYAPRTIDIDLLYLGDQVLQSEHVTLPHPMLHLRKFTLVPLCEIFPDFRHPVAGVSNRELLARLQDPLPVIRYLQQS